MKLLILSVISYISAKTVDNIYVESGKRLTISCAYTGVYVDINKEIVGPNGKRRNQVLYLRVNDGAPEAITATSDTQAWNYDVARSFYGSNETENNFRFRSKMFRWTTRGSIYAKMSREKLPSNTGLSLKCRRA